MPPRQFGWAAAAGAAAHVFVADLADECVVQGDDGHHLQRVRRLRAGEAVTAANGSGGWRSYEISRVEPGTVHLVATAPARDEPQTVPQCSVAVALTKGSGLDDVVASLTELGVSRIEPLRSARSVVRWDDARGRAAVGRWQEIAREAAMQSRRARVPEVAPLRDFASLRDRADLVLADRAGVAAGALAAPAGGIWTVVVGPEGGFAPEELTLLGAAVRVAVGRHVLRAQTAPLAVVAALTLSTTTVPDVVN
ncbi:MAG: methyltransferase, RsmE family [Actinomycetia bacterium]|nr:methyltransferase, RsmE family [Actinomycetes bacterium]